LKYILPLLSTVCLKKSLNVCVVGSPNLLYICQGSLF